MSLDAECMKILLMGIVENAAKHHEGSSPIMIEIEVRDLAVVVRVTDRGPGVPPEELKQIFSGLQVLDVRHHKSGHGLSLAICKLIAELHGGTISANRPNEGGLEVRVTIPSTRLSRPDEEPVSGARNEEISC